MVIIDVEEGYPGGCLRGNANNCAEVRSVVENLWNSRFAEELRRFQRGEMWKILFHVERFRDGYLAVIVLGVEVLRRRF
jgi:hypothetical protein